MHVVRKQHPNHIINLVNEGAVMEMTIQTHRTRIYATIHRSTSAHIGPRLGQPSADQAQHSQHRAGLLRKQHGAHARARAGLAPMKQHLSPSVLQSCGTADSSAPPPPPRPGHADTLPTADG